MEKPAYTTLWELISPARAKVDLVTQRPNRHMANRHVDKIKDDLIQGHFYPTHQGIAYDTERRLVDGQHRMEAIVASGVSAWMLVTYGLTEEAIMVIDGGRMRSLADRTTLFLGITRSKTKLAILRIIVTASRGLAVGRTVGSDIELMAALEGYKGDLEWVMEFKEVQSTPVAAALIYSSQVSKSAAKFGQLLNDKVGLEKDSPVLTILRLLSVTRGRGDVRQDIFLKTLNAQKAYVTKEKLPKLTAGPEGYEYFRRLRLKAGLDTPTPK